MERIVPHGIHVHEIAESLGWYKVCIHVGPQTTSLFVSVDGIPSHVTQVCELWLAERQGYAHQAARHAVDVMNTFVLVPYGIKLAVPDIGA